MSLRCSRPTNGRARSATWTRSRATPWARSPRRPWSPNGQAGALRADHPGEMQGKRTLLIAAVVALAAAAATLGIAALHRHADERRTRHEAFIAVEADAHRLNALEWQATAERRVPLGVQAEGTAIVARHAARSSTSSTAAASRHRPLAAFAALRPVDRRGVRAAAQPRLRARRRRSTRWPSAASTRLHAALQHAAERNRALAVRSDRISWLGTVAVMLALVFGLTALLGLLDRAARRRAARRPPPRSRLPGLADRPAQPHAVRAADRGRAPRRHARRRRLPRPRRLQARQRLARARRRRPSAGDLRRAAAQRPARGRHRRAAGRRRVRDPRARTSPTSTPWSLACSTSWPRRSCSRASACTCAPRSASPPPRPATTCCATPTSPCTPPRPPAPTAARSSPTTCTCNAVERLDRREQLERAIENEELVLHYQPIVDLDLGRAAGFEALVRWQHPDARLPRSRRVHPAGRRDRPDRPAGPLGPARGRPPGRVCGPARRT